MEVGQAVYYRYIDKNIREIRETVISKIGNKYFYTVRFGDKKFCFDLWHRDKMYSQSEFKLYLSKEEIEKEDQYSKMRDFICYYFRYHYDVTIEFEKMKKIYDILKEGTNETKL